MMGDALSLFCPATTSFLCVHPPFNLCYAYSSTVPEPCRSHSFNPRFRSSSRCHGDITLPISTHRIDTVGGTEVLLKIREHARSTLRTQQTIQRVVRYALRVMASGKSYMYSSSVPRYRHNRMIRAQPTHYSPPANPAHGVGKPSSIASMHSLLCLHAALRRMNVVAV